MLNRFCSLSTPPSVFNGQYKDGQYRTPTKIKKNTCRFYTVFQVLKVYTSYKNLKDTATRSCIYCCFISFYISRYHFSQIVKTPFNIIWKKDFRHEFSFFNRFTQSTPTLLMAKTFEAWQKFFVNAPLPSNSMD